MNNWQEWRAGTESHRRFVGIANAVAATPTNNPAGVHCHLAECQRYKIFPAKQHQSLRATGFLDHAKQYRRTSRHDKLHGHDGHKRRAVLLSRWRAIKVVSIS